MKKFLSVLLILVLSFSLAACGNNQATNESEEQQEVITLRLAHHLPETDSNNQLALKFKENLEAKTNGQVVVEIYPNGQLGGQLELLEALKLGTVEMSMADTGLLSNYEPSIGILDMPYVFDSIEHAKTIMSGEIGQYFKDKVAEISGIRPITLEAVAFRNTFLKDVMIESLEDFKGVKVRTPNAPSIIATFEALGANPTAIPSGEAYTAIQTGVVNGMEGNPEFLSSIKIYEVANNWFETQHIMTCTSLNISEVIYAELPEDIQNAINEAAAEALDYFYEFAGNADSEKRAFLAEQGVNFFTLDKEPLRAAVAPLVEEFVAEQGIEDIYQQIQDARE